MTEQQAARLQAMTGVGKFLTHKIKGGVGRTVMGKIEDEVFHMVGDYKHVIQKIRFTDGLSWDGSTHAYRTGYWTYDGKGKRIVWGQYTQFLTELEYRALLQKARDKGWQII
jgi:hypothetical protein